MAKIRGLETIARYMGISKPTLINDLRDPHPIIKRVAGVWVADPDLLRDFRREVRPRGAKGHALLEPKEVTVIEDEEENDDLETLKAENLRARTRAVTISTLEKEGVLVPRAEMLAAMRVPLEKALSIFSSLPDEMAAQCAGRSADEIARVAKQQTQIAFEHLRTALQSMDSDVEEAIRKARIAVQAGCDYAK